jgi:hypothetical protein
MWKYSKFKNPVKIIVTVFLGICVIGTYGTQNSNSSQPAESANENIKVTTIAAVTTTDKISSDKNTTTTKAITTTVTKSVDTYSPTLGEQNALSSAKNYLNTTAFSYNGLIKQLEYEKYSDKESKYAVDNCGADWNEQAAKKAKEYLNTSSFSRKELIDQLIYEGFTQKQAEYGASKVGY